MSVPQGAKEGFDPKRVFQIGQSNFHGQRDKKSIAFVQVILALHYFLLFRKETRN